MKACIERVLQWLVDPTLGTTGVQAELKAAADERKRKIKEGLMCGCLQTRISEHCTELSSNSESQTSKEKERTAQTFGKPRC